MLKQWRNENLGVIYFFVPNAKNNEILTTDGVLIPYADFKKMTSESYASKKNTNGGYDYELYNRLCPDMGEPDSNIVEYAEDVLYMINLLIDNK